MAKKRWEMKKRWTTTDWTKLEKLINSWNNKIYRVKKKGEIDPQLIPERKNFWKVKDRIYSSEDFDTEIKILEAFVKRGSEKVTYHSERGAYIPEYVIEQNKVKLSKINKDRARQRKMYEEEPLTDRGKAISKKNRFTDDALDHLNPRSLNYKNMSKKDLYASIMSLEQYKISVAKSNALYVSNYKDSIETVFSEPERTRIFNLLEGVKDEEILKMLYVDKTLNVDFNYDEELDYEIKFNALMEGWTNVINKRKKGSRTTAKGKRSNRRK